MYESPIRPQPMTDVERRLFVRKAKADRLAFDCAQLLSKGETSKAATAAGECLTLAGPEQLALWLRHYATTRFKVARGTVDDFFGTVPPDVAIQNRACEGDSMQDVQVEIELLHVEIQAANKTLEKALRDRKAANKDSPLVADLNLAVQAARQALNTVEVKLRALYESKDDG